MGFATIRPMDELHTFLFDGRPVRGLFVRLARGWPAMLARREPHDAHPLPVRKLLGEMTAAAVLMHANLRYAGTLILQLQGDGPLKLAVVEVNADLSYRATAKVVGPLADEADLITMVQGVTDPANPGRGARSGRCAITLSPNDNKDGRQTYQGIVDLTAGREEGADPTMPAVTVAEVLEHYMRQSEQLATRFVLSADEQGCGGMMIQRLPIEGKANLEGQAKAGANIDADEAFARASHFVSTLDAEEVLRVDMSTVVRRLFWQEDLRTFDVRYPSFECRCSRERVRSMLRSLGADEVRSVLAERGEVEISCDFCGAHFGFDAVDVGEMFAQPIDQPPGSSAIN
jgi:molecular chaperone Hsp33